MDGISTLPKAPDYETCRFPDKKKAKRDKSQSGLRERFAPDITPCTLTMQRDAFSRRLKNAPDTLTAKKTNERVLNEANKRRSLVRTIRKRQATFLGHVMRRGKLEHLVTTGKFEGKRSRGRQREKIMDGLATWLGTGKVLDTLTAVKDRDLWRDMVANAYKQGT
ncbi:hypothetical protein PoB_003970700 [Plakobranchus ocellatus]|uniref:Uncharacterized protein n=1 Tax=Plakobranchus ocellatus TaxID=259542 RepID=A0AAV4B269_9GAST|nr:hypothetical protein PoB_003970700 [Plakobranchus ocellatus]